MPTHHRPGLCAVTALAALVSMSNANAADAPFYRGKMLTMLINYAAGGPADGRSPDPSRDTRSAATQRN